ncbi:hypothetical protein CDCA_CDCA02G0648 [Cyanidium caldarium]|uniref:Malonyl-CoA:ACP transacylase (MAT) domain-containing protein n=1 Tax=Cyanidium caldarium TaxID=2771 RepID=A0AAV9IRG3_CYACA|nr:hypothetical protein CDCA_CDCA02G0648 [Cyanidium caldarium]
MDGAGYVITASANMSRLWSRVRGWEGSGARRALALPPTCSRSRHFVHGAGGDGQGFSHSTSTFVSAAVPARGSRARRRAGTRRRSSVTAVFQGAPDDIAPEKTPVAVLCPGQGAQFEGQGRLWQNASPKAQAVFRRADRYLGRSRTPNGRRLSDIIFEGPQEELDRTDVAQPAIFVTSMACMAGLEELGAAPTVSAEEEMVAAAGLSLGEYTALTIAQAMEFEEALELVTVRGRAMQEASEKIEGTMVAILGASDAQVREICAKCATANQVLVPANFNAPGQVVLSGSLEACGRAVQYASKELRLRTARLAVAGAFHSPLMQSAADELADALTQVEIEVPLRTRVMCNVTGRPHEETAGAIRDRLIEQLTSPVLWMDCLQYLRDEHGKKLAYLELAPGRTLAGLLRRLDRAARLTNADTPEEFMAYSGRG